MKVLVVLCALVTYVAGGAIGWPGAVPVTSSVIKAIVPGETKTTAYSNTQYINALPASFVFGSQPHYAYPVPHVNHFASLPSGYYSLAGPSHFPAANVFYPAQSGFPVFGSASIVVTPAVPSLPNGPLSPDFPPSAHPAAPADNPNEHQSADSADSAVIDSAEFASQNQKIENTQESTSQFSTPQPTESATVQSPTHTFPNFPSIPQIPQELGNTPSFPQHPQNPNVQIPSFPLSPQFPQQSEQPSSFPSIPQFPQQTGLSPSFPQVPQFPQVPGFPQNGFAQGPAQSPVASFPAPSNDDRGLNDEDTVSVESA